MVKRLTARLALTIRSCCVAAFVNNVCSSCNVRDSPVPSKHLRDQGQGQGQVIAGSDVGATTYGRHGHSA